LRLPSVKTGRKPRQHLGGGDDVLGGKPPDLRRQVLATIAFGSGPGGVPAATARGGLLGSLLGARLQLLQPPLEVARGTEAQRLGRALHRVVLRDRRQPLDAALAQQIAGARVVPVEDRQRVLPELGAALLGERHERLDVERVPTRRVRTS